MLRSRAAWNQEKSRMRLGSRGLARPDLQGVSLTPCAWLWEILIIANWVTLSLHQYITSPTRKNKTLNLCYCSINGAYKASLNPNPSLRLVPLTTAPSISLLCTGHCLWGRKWRKEKSVFEVMMLFWNCRDALTVRIGLCSRTLPQILMNYWWNVIPKHVKWP